VLHCVEVCCSVMRFDAMCCSALYPHFRQLDAIILTIRMAHSRVCCSVLQCVAVCSSGLQCVAVCCSVLQCVALCCSVLQCVAVRLTLIFDNLMPSSSRSVLRTWSQRSVGTCQKRPRYVKRDLHIYVKRRGYVRRNHDTPRGSSSTTHLWHNTLCQKRPKYTKQNTKKTLPKEPYQQIERHVLRANCFKET